MEKEKKFRCDWCLGTINEVIEENPGWPKRRLAGEVIKQVEQIGQEVGCENKVCIPLKRAAKVYYGEQK